MILAELRPALQIAAREVRDQFRDWRIIFPAVALTVFFPFLMNFTAQQILGFVERYGATIIGERMVPFLLMITGFFPISVSLVIALESFVGEKERGSIEPLLNTPLKDWQLYLGKLLSSVVPPLFTSYLGMGVYLGGLLVGQVRLPTFDLLALVFLLSTVQAVVMVSGAVVVSTQATSVRAANLLASFIIIPMALMIQGEAIVMFWGTYSTLWVVVGGLLILAFLLVRVGLAHFQREELLGHEIDVLNLRWGWGVFRRAFTGGAKNLWDWYRNSIRQTLNGLGRPVLMMSLLGIAGIFVGWYLTKVFPLPIQNLGQGDWRDQVQSSLDIWPLFARQNFVAFLSNNIRFMLLSVILGMLSLGILGVLPTIATIAVTSYLVITLSVSGLPGFQILLGFILPHGWLEIGAGILASAVILQSGARLASASEKKTIGEVFIISLADWVKIFVGVVIPALILAAAIEIWITPRIASLLLGG